MKSVRLPPKPVDTALAQAVGRIVDAVSDYLPWVLRDRIRIMQARQIAMAAHMHSMERALQQLRQDYDKFLRPPTRNEEFQVNLSERIEDEGPPWGKQIIRELTVEFLPLRFAFALPWEPSPDTELGDETIYVLRQLAKNLALAHVNQFAEEIFRQTLTRKGIPYEPLKGK